MPQTPSTSMQLTCFEGRGLDDAAGAVADFGGVGRDGAGGREEKLNFSGSGGRAVRSMHSVEGLVWNSKEAAKSMPIMEFFSLGREAPVVSKL